MTALAGTRPGSIKFVHRELRPLAAGAKVYQGALAVAIVGGATSVGYYRNGIPSPDVVAVGRFTQTVDNTSGSDGTLSAEINFFSDRWLFLLNNDTTTAVAAANRESPCYVLDDQTVTANPEDNGIAGIVYDVTSEGVWVEVRRANPAANASPSLGQGSFFARAIATSLAAYAGTTTGTLTASATGAIGAQDGVTLVAGDVVLLPEGLTNLTAASDAGPYVVVNPGGTGIKYVLTRPSWWASGNQIPATPIEIGAEGTKWKATEWKSLAVKGSQVIDGNAPALYPGRVTTQVTLSGGTFALPASQAGFPIFSATQSQVIPVYAGAGTPNAATLSYAPGVITPGVIGTATATVSSVKAGMVAQGSDTSVLNVTIINW